MMVDTTIYGYVFDGYVLHPDCVMSEEENSAVDDGTASRLYYLDDNDPNGLTCDHCTEWIFEPDYDMLVVQGIDDILNDPDIVGWRRAEAILSYLKSEMGLT
jgi:hypothetical protein